MTRTIVAMAVAGLVGRAVSANAQSTPTFSKDVAPILYKNCTNCHRDGEIGPMPLVTYKDARPFARSIAMKVENGTMPPWHADEPTHRIFSNDRSLSEADKNVHPQVGARRSAGRQSEGSARAAAIRGRLDDG